MTYHEAYQYLVENHVEPYVNQAQPKDEFDEGKVDFKRSYHVICAYEFMKHLELSAKEEKLVQASDNVSCFFLDLTLEDELSKRKQRRSRKHKDTLVVKPRRSRSLRRSSLQVKYEMDDRDPELRRKRSKRSRSKSRN